MTGTECYQAALSLLAETEDTAGYYERFALPGINQLLANSRRELSALRQAQGETAPLGVLRIEALTETLPMPDDMARECLPYGLAALLVCDDDKQKFNWCAAEYADRLRAYCPASLLPIEEMY